MNKSTVLKGDTTNRSWHLVDLQGQTLGRIATKIASLLIGKSKPTFSYHRDDGDYVVAINASGLVVTGKKKQQKLYQRYSGFPGGLKEATYQELFNKDPSLVVTHAVKGMIPKNRLRDIRIARLKVYQDANHPYAKNLNK